MQQMERLEQRLERMEGDRADAKGVSPTRGHRSRRRDSTGSPEEEWSGMDAEGFEENTNDHDGLSWSGNGLGHALTDLGAVHDDKTGPERGTSGRQGAVAAKYRLTVDDTGNVSREDTLPSCIS